MLPDSLEMLVLGSKRWTSHSFCPLINLFEQSSNGEELVTDDELV